ncbi:MAG: hypothetical protein ACO3JL_03285, partial [Myxococcota bacterium]
PESESMMNRLSGLTGQLHVQDTVANTHLPPINLILFGEETEARPMFTFIASSLTVGLLIAAFLTPLAVRRVRRGTAVSRATFGVLFPSVAAAIHLPRAVILYSHFSGAALDDHGFCGHPWPGEWLERYLLPPLLISFALTLAASVLVAIAAREYSKARRSPNSQPPAPSA